MCSPEQRERYVNFYTDFAFKEPFGTEADKDLLIGFLNPLFDGREVVKDYWDFFSVTATAEKKGHEAGLAEGMEKGLAESSRKVASNLKSMGLPVDKIAEATGLSEHDIESL